MRQQYPYSWLLRIAAQASKYFLLGLVGCSITYILSIVLEFAILFCAIAPPTCSPHPLTLSFVYES